MIFINFFIVYLQKQPPEGSIAEVPEACNLIEKEIPSQMFSTEFWEMFRNTYFVEHLETAASERQQINYRFNIKNGVIEKPFNYLSKK